MPAGLLGRHDIPFTMTTDSAMGPNPSGGLVELVGGGHVLRAAT